MSISKIAFTGPFGDSNFGDYGMLINNIYDIGCQDIVLLTHDKTFSAAITKDYLEEFNLDIIDIKLKDYDRLDGYAYTPIEMLDLIENKDIIIAGLEDVDVVVVNGGGYFNGYWSKQPRLGKLMKIMTSILVANQLNKKIIFTGNSLGPFGDEQDLYTNFFASLNHTYFAARDDLYSKTWFRQLGIDAEVRLIPDDLLFINANIIQKNNQLTIKSKDYVVLETYFSKDYITHHIDKFKTFVTSMREKYQLSVVFLPLDIGDSGEEQGRLVKEEIAQIELISIEDTGYLPLQDAVSIIANAKMVVSSRYHAVVIALANKVPVMSALGERMGDKRYYYNKNVGLIRQVFDSLDIDELSFFRSDMINALDVASRDYAKIRDTQLKLMASSAYHQNMENLLARRKDHIDLIRNGA